jgi:hypothetical protein
VLGQKQNPKEKRGALRRYSLLGFYVLIHLATAIQNFFSKPKREKRRIAPLFSFGFVLNQLASSQWSIGSVINVREYIVYIFNFLQPTSVNFASLDIFK